MWKDLSISKKSDIIRKAVDSGVTNLSDIRDSYNSFAEGGSMGYPEWKRDIAEKKGLDIDNDTSYNYREFYDENPEMAEAMLRGFRDTHFTDRYKTPSHPTFSDESKYSNDTTKGGHWVERADGVWEFQHSDYTANHIAETNEYIKNNEDPRTYASYLGNPVLNPSIITANRKGFGGRIYDGETEESGQMSILQKGLDFLSYSSPLLYLVNRYVKNRNKSEVKPAQPSIDDVVDGYMDHVMWTMENPTNKGLGEDGKYYPYRDKDAKGNVHINIGPGIESSSDIATGLDYSGKTGYTINELNNVIRPDLVKKMTAIDDYMKENYPETRDTMSIGNRMIQLDIAHNVAPRRNNGNMPISWPTLTKAFVEGDDETARKNTYSKSRRRQQMRNDLLWKKEVDENTVKNR